MVNAIHPLCVDTKVTQQRIHNVADSIDNKRRLCYTCKKGGGAVKPTKTISMSIRVNEEELQKLKLAANLLSYSSYSEFVRRTALMEANRVIETNASNTKQKEGKTSQ